MFFENTIYVILIKGEVLMEREHYMVNGIANENMKTQIKNALEKIKDKEKYIIVQRYMMGKTQTELASEIGISQAQISRLEKNGLSKIKKMIR